MYGVTKSRYKYKIVIQYNLLNSFHSSSSNSNQCYYKTLGIVRHATDKDIRTAYIQMAKKFHPDVNTKSDSTAKFSSINEAYSILSDKNKKQKYDTQIGNYSNNQTQTKSSSKNWWDFNFYGNKQSTNNTNTNANDYDYYDNDFEFNADFYGDFSRFTHSNNNNNSRNRKRKRDIYEQFEHNKSNSKNNPYADYYYYYQQQIKNNNNSKQKYETIWTDFEFDFDIDNEFDSEFNNDAFWRFLRNNNKKHRTKQNKNENNINEKKSKNNKEKIKEKYKHNNENDKSDKKHKEKEKENEKEKEAKKSNNNSKKSNEIGVNDISINLDLDFLEASLGCTKTINFNRNEICASCGGTSYDQSIECIKCIKCDGKGLIYGYGSDFLSHKCINCSGHGYIFKNCTNCMGKSIININKSLTITIPSGVRDNDRVRVSKQGHQYTSYSYNTSNYNVKYGHIWINCNIEKHKYFVRIGNDIHITMNIPYVLAVLGGSFVVPTIYGPNIIKILTGINTNDYEILEGKGIYDSSTNKKGNQCVHFKIDIPNVNELNAQQKQLLNQYAKLEKAPNVVQTERNLKHFKKYGKKVQSYEESDSKWYGKDNGYDESDIDGDEEDGEMDGNDENEKNEKGMKDNVVNDNNEYFTYSDDVDIDDDLKDLL